MYERVNMDIVYKLTFHLTEAMVHINKLEDVLPKLSVIYPRC